MPTPSSASSTGPPAPCATVLSAPVGLASSVPVEGSFDQPAALTAISSASTPAMAYTTPFAAPPNRPTFSSPGCSRASRPTLWFTVWTVDMMPPHRSPLGLPVAGASQTSGTPPTGALVSPQVTRCGTNIAAESDRRPRPVGGVRGSGSWELRGQFGARRDAGLGEDVGQVGLDRGHAHQGLAP